MAVTVTTSSGKVVEHVAAVKWIADPVGNLVIIQNAHGRATHIYAASEWSTAQVTS